VNQNWSTLAGLRNDDVWSDADPVERFYTDSEADALALLPVTFSAVSWKQGASSVWTDLCTQRKVYSNAQT
jgi:hypothetical protein